MSNFRDKFTEDEVVSMTLACKNVDKDNRGWYALIVDKSNCNKEHLAYGSTAWKAVKKVHEICSLFNKGSE